MRGDRPEDIAMLRGMEGAPPHARGRDQVFGRCWERGTDAV